VRELLDLSVVRLAKIDYVSDAERLKRLHLSLRLYSASKREPFAHEEGFHLLTLVGLGNRHGCLENLCFTNVIFVQPGPL
jgi:hypothetical protein